MVAISNISSARLNFKPSSSSADDADSLIGSASSSSRSSAAGGSKTSNAIADVTTQIRNLQRNGESFDGQLDGLRDQRDAMIRTFTGNPSADGYDVDVIGWSQSRGTTYNFEAQQLNESRRNLNTFRPADSQIPYVGEVRDLPWELPKINDRVDDLVRTEGLSVDAGIVIAMSERTILDTLFAPSKLEGSWQPDFAARASRAGSEIAVWAAAEVSDTSNVSITLAGGPLNPNVNVTIRQNAAGQIVVVDDNGELADRVIDPGGAERVVIIGSAGDDRITIASSVTESMVVAGGAGDDKLFGGNGHDILIGGDGVDLIRGNQGTDIIIGGAGDDNIEGGRGGDIIRGGDGGDYISGGIGSDVVDGGTGRDSLYGGFGKDLIRGGTGNDYIDGGAANDLLSGGLGNDTVSGGAGSDRLNGGGGNDTLIGASGTDYYDDSNSGDHVIQESSESIGGDGASRSSIVDFDPSILDVRGGSIENEYVTSAERSEFQLRIRDDLETLRFTEAGQQMLTDLRDAELNSGTQLTITEMDPIQDTIVLPGRVIPTSTENGFASAPGRTLVNVGGTPLPGAGVNSTVFYNTSVNLELNEATGRENTPPIIVLFHELSHAFNQLTGTGVSGTYNGTDTFDVGQNNGERQAVGLTLSNAAGNDVNDITGQQTENDLRAELGIGDRISYRNPPP